MRQMAPEAPLNIRLGKVEAYGFYKADDTKKGYTTINKGKMAWNVLDILQRDNFALHMGLLYHQISDELVERQPNIVVDDYGLSTTLEMLLKDFEDGELIVRVYNGRSCKNVITKLGRLFFQRNTVDTCVA